eukprot:CAMPEP_0201536932 /NCGR_PEP_ID=MMETSP0161_2-20130828/63352_1 /ASSEMBLY_ACC=CAM_ASM_000251 /TAXON_ID=180227 /ORGANISM="Neoparamoeba aestuarina, Strain SoJaBio B1-5/56/2" /LENGTH=354 /DNA_ID=CAMNT_0047942947 /DNA_START=187 /DNA_END=1251 /DNA_ORIENTATION=+
MEVDQPLDYSEQRLDLDEFGDEMLVSFSDKPNKTFEKALEGVRKDIIFLDLTNNRLTKLEGLDEYTQLRRLDLRANQIEKIENLDKLEILEELDLYENHFTQIEGLNLPNLKYLDLSFNQIRSLGEEPFAKLPKLRELYLVQNKIKEIGAGSLDCLAGTLVTLEMGANRLKKIENLEKLINLRHLWLGKNKISEIENLNALTNLRVLSFQRNRITKISEGLKHLTKLEELYLSENGIEEVENLSELKNLKILDIGRNRLTKVDHIAALTSLNELWLNNNQIETVVDLECVKSLTKLNTLYVEFNPLSKDTQHRKKLVDFCPTLEQIDASLVISDSQRREFMDSMKIGKVTKKTT